MPLLDTRRSNDLTGTLIADIVLQLLSYVAQTERENIRQRQAEGIAAAKARGVKFGRRPKPKPPEFLTLKKKYYAGEISARNAAKQLGITHSTFIRWVHKIDMVNFVYIFDRCFLSNLFRCGIINVSISWLDIAATKLYFCNQCFWVRSRLVISY